MLVVPVGDGTAGPVCRSAKYVYICLYVYMLLCIGICKGICGGNGGVRSTRGGRDLRACV